MRGFIPGNRLRLLRNGVEYFPALLSAIDFAQHELLLESYIFEFDDIGEAVALALIAAARRGVVVKLHLDGYGSRDFPADWLGRLLAAGVQVLFFRPEVGRFFFDRARLRRLHRKLAVVDGETAFVGGINIISDFNRDNPGPAPRHDYAVEVSGPVVLRIHAAMDRLWRQTAWVRFRHDWLRKSRLRPLGLEEGASPVRFLLRDNLRHRHDIEHEYLRAIEAARDEIVIACAYFLPGWRFRHALVRAAARGVRVVLLLQGVMEYAILHYATRGFYHQFLAAGIEIHEYRLGYMHAKVAVIDGHWSTVGSSNLDPFSLLLAREANLFVEDMGFAAQLRRELRQMRRSSTTEIQLADLRQARPIQRLLPWLCFGIARFLMGVFGFGKSRYWD